MNITVFADNQRELALPDMFYINIELRIKKLDKNCNINII